MRSSTLALAAMSALIAAPPADAVARPDALPSYLPTSAAGNGCRARHRDKAARDRGKLNRKRKLALAAKRRNRKGSR